ncbi:MAG: hypothetical protein R3C20_01300 [Planctomycetaceae bacterium]
MRRMQSLLQLLERVYHDWATIDENGVFDERRQAGIPFRIKRPYQLPQEAAIDRERWMLKCQVLRVCELTDIRAENCLDC